MTLFTHFSTKKVASFPNQFTSIAVFLLSAACLVVPSGYSIGAVMLFIAGVGMIIARRLPVLTKQDTWVIAALLAYAVVNMLEAWLDGQGSSGLDRPIRFILAIPALLWVLRYPPKLAYLWGGIAVGAITAGSWSGWQKLVEGVERAQGHTQVIQFGNLSMLLGVLCIAGLGWAATQRRCGIWLALLLLGAAGGMLGSLFSGSRGGWVGFPIVLLVLYRAYGNQLSVKLKIATLVAVVVGGATVYAVPQMGVQERIHHGFSDVAQYISGENRSTSVGARFDMWRGAALLIKEKPLTGWGSNGYADAMSAFGEAGVISDEAAQYGHAHNEFIDALAKRGLLGLVVLLTLYFVPLRLFARHLKAKHLGTRALATAGVLLPVTFMDFGLTQVFMGHNSGVMMYAFLLVTLWGTYNAARPHPCRTEQTG
ncbi:O-antigen ligase family protein [Halomonas sp. GFAJ-1]|uniref:O-antigen ligase family protein n=1 Tax=Halomonas sp. GFAJ-1 TaxID=1118153 RepID=UPI00023A41CD|nr:O-antigen ligase family protein [Halomonas sp. GFAJ-1]AVI62909.1 ligase [Halomonas sp. GFAJ-1]EHK62030.1 Lipid A core--O-antigen ligase [Halomonas sp. GFAJ-1]